MTTALLKAYFGEANDNSLFKPSDRVRAIDGSHESSSDVCLGVTARLFAGETQDVLREKVALLYDLRDFFAAEERYAKRVSVYARERASYTEAVTAAGADAAWFSDWGRSVTVMARTFATERSRLNAIARALLGRERHRAPHLEPMWIILACAGGGRLTEPFFDPVLFANARLMASTSVLMKLKRARALNTALIWLGNLERNLANRRSSLGATVLSVEIHVRGCIPSLAARDCEAARIEDVAVTLDAFTADYGTFLSLLEKVPPSEKRVFGELGFTLLPLFETRAERSIELLRRLSNELRRNAERVREFCLM